MAQRQLTGRNVSSGKSITFDFTQTALSITHDVQHKIAVDLHQVIMARFMRETQVAQVAYLDRKRKKDPMFLVRIDAEVKDAEAESVEEWAEALMQLVYEDAGIQRSRRLKILVNPHGGTRRGVTAFSKIVAPIFDAAGCITDVIQTTHNGHAYDIAKELVLEYDAVVTVSGDGLIHEVLNGFAHHAQAAKAFAIPVAPIPAGSGNGLSLNLLGIDDGFDIAAAALNVIKGKPMKVDVFSVTQNGQRSVSFMSQALGLMADLDAGTENLRWMGDTRFIVGLLRGIIQFKPCPVKLSFKLAEQDKLKMAETLLERRLNDRNGIPATPFLPAEEETNGLPPLKYTLEEEDGWVTFDKPLLYVYAGKGPYVGRDFMAFPVSLPDDGLIDIVAQELSTRRGFLTQATKGAGKGESYWHETAHYFKAHAYRVRPFSPKGTLTVDGELFPFEEFQVEVHQRLASLLSPHGFYAADFEIPPKIGAKIVSTGS